MIRSHSISSPRRTCSSCSVVLEGGPVEGGREEDEEEGKEEEEEEEKEEGVCW
jgi:hypothetical protein